jgi:hypothetical protein
MKYGFLIFLLLTFCGGVAAQETLINVPSADIVPKGYLHTQAQANYQPSPALFTYSQSLAYGVGHGLEFDVEGNNMTRQSTAVGGVGFKWAPYTHGNWQTFVSDLVSVSPPSGNMLYLGAARTIAKYRVTAGVWNAQTVGNRTGAFLGLEYNVTKRVAPQCDWLSGASGQSACAVAITLTKSLSIAPGYTWGNTGIKNGNHSALVQINWEFK